MANENDKLSITLKSSWEEIFGNNINEFSPEQRRANWLAWKNLALKERTKEEVEYWETGEGCIKDERVCKHKKEGEGWCNLQGLPCGYNPVTKMIGMACMGASYTPSEKIRTCRVCGCTDDNCQQCVEKTGKPCHWVEDDLCSACYDAIKNTVNEVNAEITPWSSDPANFFQQLYPLLDGIDVMIKVKRKNGRLTISLLPETSSVITPAILTGTPEELDNGFFAAVSAPISDAKGLKIDLDNYKKSLEKSKEKKGEKTKTDSKTVKPGNTKKPAKSKEKAKARTEEKPKVSAPDLFATV